MLCNRFIQVQHDKSKSRLRRLNNGLPQGSVFLPILFNIYTRDLPTTRCKYFIYADDLVICYQAKSFDEIEKILEEDLKVIREYYTSWRLKMNAEKTTTCFFHLNNSEAKRSPRIVLDSVVLNHDEFPKYLGIRLDRTLSYNKHLNEVAMKVRTRCNMLQKLCGTNWGANAEVLRQSTISLINSVADYGCPVWFHSSHVNQVDIQLNIAMRIITGVTRNTPLAWLPVLSNIVPPDLRRKSAFKSLILNANTTKNSLLYNILQDEPYQRLNSKETISTKLSKLTNFDVLLEWKNNWLNEHLVNNEFINNPCNKLNGFDLSRNVWIRLNRIRTNIGNCGYWLKKWNINESEECDCGAESQTISHLIKECQIRKYNGEFSEIFHCSNDKAHDYVLLFDINL